MQLQLHHTPPTLYRGDPHFFASRGSAFPSLPPPPNTDIDNLDKAGCGDDLRGLVFPWPFPFPSRHLGFCVSSLISTFVWSSREPAPSFPSIALLHPPPPSLYLLVASSSSAVPTSRPRLSPSSHLSLVVAPSRSASLSLFAWSWSAPSRSFSPSSPLPVQNDLARD